MASITLDDVTLGYDGHPAVHHLKGTFASGSLTAIAGPNGSGKSTLMKGLAGILSPLGGHITRSGCAARDIAYLPQAHDIDRSFPATVGDLVQSGLWHRRGNFAALTNADRHDVHHALEHVGLRGFERRDIGTLSGGQFQRALFARVLLQDAKLILLDEPFTAIDGKTTADLLKLIARWHNEKRTVLAVLHDFELIKAHFPETLLMAREPVAWGDTRSVIAPANLLQARTMTEAWDDNAEECAA
ncbi:zinc ABC transporter ATP-binding protein AztA [Aestuariivirga litoralis]|uniref:zinc ABC transporter ATP-binding protein AztA n=1 Tax=Aestuariivirga litoralis TaxID=2650924 RepID=UPI0018C4A995|nr:zinc ABC transporter ATP-binding protein AztA [Aestuariivirga litoralis]MBG1232600.1 ABC transporter ATP-binding protein [Aestuariivirga litoralis]